MRKNIKRCNNNTTERPSLFKTILTSWLLFGTTRAFAGFNDIASTNASDQIHWNNGTGNFTYFNNSQQFINSNIKLDDYKGCLVADTNHSYVYDDIEGWIYHPIIALFTGNNTNSRTVTLDNNTVINSKEIWGQSSNQPYVGTTRDGRFKMYNGDYTGLALYKAPKIAYPGFDDIFGGSIWNQGVANYIYKNKNRFKNDVIKYYDLATITVGYDKKYIEQHGGDFDIPQWVLSTNISDYAKINNKPIRAKSGLRHIQAKHPFVPHNNIIDCKLDNIYQASTDFTRCASLAVLCNQGDIVISFISPQKIKSRGGIGLGINFAFNYIYTSSTPGLTINKATVYVAFPFAIFDKKNNVTIGDDLGYSATLATAYTTYAIDGSLTKDSSKQKYPPLNDWKGCADSVSLSDKEWDDMTIGDTGYGNSTAIEKDMRDRICSMVKIPPPIDYITELENELKIISSIITSLMKVLDKLEEILLPPEEDKAINKLITALEEPEILELIGIGLIPIIGLSENIDNTIHDTDDVDITENNFLDYILKVYDKNKDIQDALSEFNISRSEIDDLNIKLPEIINNTPAPISSYANQNEVNGIYKFIASTSTNVLKNFNKLAPKVLSGKSISNTINSILSR